MLHNFRPSKRYGQNFLTDYNIIRKTIKVAGITKHDVVLEIGPGKGVLTQALLQHAKKVIAVEVDRALFHELHASMGSCDNLFLLCEDILKIDLKDLILRLHINSKITVVANIPYSITTPIIEYLFRHIELLSNIFLMVQKEYAERLVAKPRSENYSSLSCFARFYCEPKILFGVSRSCFRPQPKVDSSFILLAPREKDFWKNSQGLTDEKFLLTFIRTAFNQRRKTLSNALLQIVEKYKVEDALVALGLNKHSRAEDLSLDDFIHLSIALAQR